MFKHIKGRFYIEGISFALPDNFYFRKDNGLGGERQIEFVSEDGVYTIEYSVYDCELNTDEELEGIVRDGEYRYIEPMTAITMNGLTGHQCVYCSNDKQYFEVHFKPDQLREFVFCIYTERKDLCDVKNSSQYRQILTDIRKEA